MRPLPVYRRRSNTQVRSAVVGRTVSTAVNVAGFEASVIMPATSMLVLV